MELVFLFEVKGVKMVNIGKNIQTNENEVEGWSN